MEYGTFEASAKHLLAVLVLSFFDFPFSRCCACFLSFAHSNDLIETLKFLGEGVQISTEQTKIR